jgi:RNA recognition motif-containing protein
LFCEPSILKSIISFYRFNPSFILTFSNFYFSYIFSFFQFFSMNIFVAKLNFSTRSEGLREVFERFGEVEAANVIMDRETGRSKGFAFVEMADDSEAQAAIASLDGTDLDGSTIVVKQAEPRENRSGGGGGGFNRGGGGGGGGFNRGGGGGGGGFNRGGGGGGGYNDRRSSDRPRRDDNGGGNNRWNRD